MTDIKVNIDPNSDAYKFYQEMIDAGADPASFDTGYVSYEHGPGMDEYRRVVTGDGDGVIEKDEVWQRAFDGSFCKQLAGMFKMVPASCPFDDLDPKTNYDGLLRQRLNGVIDIIKLELKEQGLNPSEPLYKRRLAYGIHYFLFAPDKGHMERLLSTDRDEAALMLEGLELVGLPKFKAYLAETGGLDVGNFNDDENERGHLAALTEWRGKCTESAEVEAAMMKMAGLDPIFVWANDSGKVLRSVVLNDGGDFPEYMLPMTHVFMALDIGGKLTYFDLRNHSDPSPNLYLNSRFGLQLLSDREFYAFKLMNDLTFGGNDPEVACKTVEEIGLNDVPRSQLLASCSSYLSNKKGLTEDDIIELKSNFERALELDRASPMTALLYSNFLNKIGERDKAISVLKEAADANRYALPLHYQLVNLYLNKKNLASAREYVKLIEEVADETGVAVDARLYYWLCLKDGRIDEAREILRSAIAKAKTPAEKAAFMAELTSVTEDPAEGERLAKRSLALMAGKEGYEIPAIELSRFMRGEAGRNEYFDIIGALPPPSKINDDNVSLLVSLYLHNGEIDKAGELFDRYLNESGLQISFNPAEDGSMSIDVTPKGIATGVTTMIFYAYFRLSSDADKDKRFTLLHGMASMIAKMSEPDRTDALFKLADSIDVLPPQAKAEYMEACFVPVFKYVIQDYSDNKEYGRMISLAGKFLDITPEAGLGLVSAYKGLGNNRKAVEVANELVLKYADSEIDDGQVLGQLYLELGEFAKASPMLERFCKHSFEEYRVVDLYVGLMWMYSAWRTGDDVGAAGEYVRNIIGVRMADEQSFSGYIMGVADLVAKWPKEFADDAVVKETLFTVYHEMGRQASRSDLFNIAIKLILKASEYAPNDHIIYSELAYLYDQIGESEKSQEMREKSELLKTGPVNVSPTQQKKK